MLANLVCVVLNQISAFLCSGTDTVQVSTLNLILV